ncbi:hypothetical protein EVAR_15055_1 [Eumeta japonica]|uniref:Uncharacterized protein n=1 Tax=Eumeta variegata TaxID=151549 RepID=A0A4C1YI12_EUMVA|nr:hypothetical protein EVAR_15055_1 [Eumeta japonica]
MDVRIRVDTERAVSTDVEKHASSTGELLIELEVYEFGKLRETSDIAYVIGIVPTEDTQYETTSQISSRGFSIFIFIGNKRRRNVISPVQEALNIYKKKDLPYNSSSDEADVRIGTASLQVDERTQLRDAVDCWLRIALGNVGAASWTTVS